MIVRVSSIKAGSGRPNANCSYIITPTGFSLTYFCVVQLFPSPWSYSHLKLRSIREYVHSIHGIVIRGTLTRSPFLEELEPLGFVHWHAIHQAIRHRAGGSPVVL